MMFSDRKRTTAAAGVFALAVLVGCGGEPSVASKSAAAFQQAQKEGKTFEGAGHEHGGHGGHEMPEGTSTAAGTGAHQHGQAQEADHSAMGHGEEHPAGEHGGHGSHAEAPAAAGHEHSGHSQPAAQGHQGHGQGHEGHGNAAAPRPADPARDHSGHAPSAPVAELPAEPASLLRPDTLDAPAATSAADAQRSEEMSQSMSGGHAGHGTSTYRHIDAGRGQDAHEGSEPQPPAAGHEHHDHGATPGQSAAVYICPMHPEVTSNAPGTCPKCGMALVKRTEG